MFSTFSGHIIFIAGTITASVDIIRELDIYPGDIVK
jgi:hypothetical protein